MNSIVAIFLLFSAFISPNSYGVSRFESDQLSFTLHEEGWPPIACRHKPLKTVTPVPAPPWWTVTCNDRIFTVDIWISEQLLANNKFKIAMMLHAKEGAASSGEKLAQFQSHYTQFVVTGESSFDRLTSFLDVRNGLASLEATALIDKK